MAAKSARKVVSVEINPKAANVIEFNAKLNGLQDIIDIRVGDLYSVLENKDLFDAIYANPPFIPMLEDITYPICGSGGRDGLDILNKIISKLNQYLTNDGIAIIFCQCLGNSNSVFFNDYLREHARNVNWEIISAIIDKIPLDYQIFQLSKLTALYNSEFDRQGFEREMKNNYNSLGATCLYSLIYKIKKSDNNSLKILTLCNDWSIEDSASVEKNISIEKNNSSYIVCKNNEKIGFFDEEAKDTYDLLNTYGSLKKVLECIKSKSTSIDITCKLLQACNMMEKMGIIKKM